jgi:hypothetical protein
MNRVFTASLAAAAMFATGALAADQLQVSYPGDGAMDCAAISAESARMDQVIAEANGQAASADGQARGAGLASTVAVEGLARSGALARMPGIGRFANQAASMARQHSEAVKAQAANTVQAANTRKAMMLGLYTGKACDAAPPAAAPAAPAGL